MPFLFFVCPLQKQSHVAPPHTHTPPPITLPSHPASLSLFTPHPSCHCEVCVSCLTVYSPSPYPQHHTPLYTPTPRLQLLHFYLTPTPFAPQAPPPLSHPLSLSPPCLPITPREVTSAGMRSAGSRCTAASSTTAAATATRASEWANDTPALISIPSPSPNHLASPQCNINEPLSFEYIISRPSTLLH